MQFRKKPVVIEAVKFSEGQIIGDVPAWVDQAIENMTIYRHAGSLIIKTLEGEMEVRNGDWIIRGVAGEFYSCKPEIFVKTYEPV